MLDGHQALDTVGKRLEARGMVTRLQPGLTRAALNDDRLGPILDALLAAKLNQVCSAVARKAVAVEAIPTPGRQQDTTTIRLYGASEDEPKSPEAPPPAYGPSQEGRDDRCGGGSDHSLLPGCQRGRWFSPRAAEEAPRPVRVFTSTNTTTRRSKTIRSNSPPAQR